MQDISVIEMMIKSSADLAAPCGPSWVQISLAFPQLCIAWKKAAFCFPQLGLNNWLNEPTIDHQLPLAHKMFIRWSFCRKGGCRLLHVTSWLGELLEGIYTQRAQKHIWMEKRRNDARFWLISYKFPLPKDARSHRRHIAQGSSTAAPWGRGPQRLHGIHQAGLNQPYNETWSKVQSTRKMCVIMFYHHVPYIKFPILHYNCP